MLTLVNNMATDSLPSFVARTSVATVLNSHDKCVLSYMINVLYNFSIDNLYENLIFFQFLK